jgi:hypothetical protein
LIPRDDAMESAMDREKDLASAVACRCEAISEAVGLRRSTGIDFVRNVIDAFPAEGSAPAADRAWRTRAYLLSQAFHCRVPTAAVKPLLRDAWNRGSVAAMHEALLSCPEFHTSRQATASLVMIPDTRPVMDVSYTTQLGFTSGIQRHARPLGRPHERLRATRCKRGRSPGTARCPRFRRGRPETADQSPRPRVGPDCIMATAADRTDAPAAP